ncbi:tRNA dimethylallyltransferase isoform X2 [Aphidius gifuensis]|uniref:tRNA dimethylallyltransferase isoform X2 n=1 Tax=Aphidius gifuensis TaxID=684658 RepID=UPI001CDC4165|nr:tRNA dimethylallyltransferase isoform X2 [Aphidius gifuensis]
MVDNKPDTSMTRLPIFVILGSTGTGKSRLGIELAKRFAGEIISADSMQVYKELDIITAKVTKEEKLAVPHHMLDLIDPLVNYCVTDYQRAALPIINDVITRRKLPIIVGGTNYYIESLLWQVLLADPELIEGKVNTEDNKKNDVTTCDTDGDNDKKNDVSTCDTDGDNDNDLTSSKKMKFDDSIESNLALHQKLSKIDPEMARRLHPNNRRKIIRSIEVFENHGITHSEILKKQRTEGGCGLGGPLRFQNSIIVWLRCDQEILDDRLDRRVDSMIETGLINELLNFHECYAREWTKINLSPDYTKGIFQSIGFKEFHNYLILPDDEKKSEKGQALFDQGVKDLKLVTKRYARRQQRWIMNRFVKRTDRQVPPIYELNCTNLDNWNTDVLKPAVDIINSILNNEKIDRKTMQDNCKEEKKTDSSNETTYWCEM